MLQRNRLVAALALSAVLFLALPAPSRAVAAVWQQDSPVAALGERVWSWIAELWPGGDSSRKPARWEKEGGAINPDGQPRSTTTPPQNGSEGAK